MTRRSRKVGIKEKKIPNKKLREYIVSDLKSLNIAAQKLTGKAIGFAKSDSISRYLQGAMGTKTKRVTSSAGKMNTHVRKKIKKNTGPK